MENEIDPPVRRSLKQKLGSLFGFLVFVFFVATICQVIYYKYFPPFVSQKMAEEKWISNNKSKNTNLRYDWVSIDKISKNLQLAVIASEDQNFPNHSGFDFKAMQKAYKSNKRGKKIKGASTISQQVAKNLFLWHGRSYPRKILEVYYTFLIETCWSKKRILEVYLNIAEMGQLVFGAEGASRYYFKKPARDLTKAEAASLAVILPNPKKFAVKNPSAYISRKKQWVLRQMNHLGNKHLIL